MLLIATVNLDPTVATSPPSFLNVKQLGIMRELIINAPTIMLKRAPMKHDSQKQARLKGAPSTILKDPTKDNEIADSLIGYTLTSAVCSIPQVPVYPFNTKATVEYAKIIVYPQAPSRMALLLRKPAPHHRCRCSPVLQQSSILVRYLLLEYLPCC